MRSGSLGTVFSCVHARQATPIRGLAHDRHPMRYRVETPSSAPDLAKQRKHPPQWASRLPARRPGTAAHQEARVADPMPPSIEVEVAGRLRVSFDQDAGPCVALRARGWWGLEKPMRDAGGQVAGLARLIKRRIDAKSRPRLLPGTRLPDGKRLAGHGASAGGIGRPRRAGHPGRSIGPIRPPQSRGAN